MIEQVILTKEEYQKLKEQADMNVKTKEEIERERQDAISKVVHTKVRFISDELSRILRTNNLSDLASVNDFIVHNQQGKYETMLNDLDSIFEDMYDYKQEATLHQKGKEKEKHNIPWYKRIFKRL